MVTTIPVEHKPKQSQKIKMVKGGYSEEHIRSSGIDINHNDQVQVRRQRTKPKATAKAIPPLPQSPAAVHSPLLDF
jgi:hypothetical protein